MITVSSGLSEVEEVGEDLAIWVSACGPTLPSGAASRSTAIARMCWHCAADTASSPLSGSGSMVTSDRYPRIVEVSGTTWTTLGS
jgi:hypothetical protein